MATNRILSNAREFVKSLDAAALEIHKQTMIGMADWIDNVRQAAVKEFMVPNAFASRTIVKRITRKFNIFTGKWEHIDDGDLGAWVMMGNGHLKRLNKIQKPHASKTTVRTGRLAHVIGIKGEWKLNRPATDLRFAATGKDSDVPLFWVRPQTVGSGPGAIRVYIARISFKDTDEYMKYRLSNETGGPVRGGRNKPARPFMKPAIDAGGQVFEPIVWRRMSPATEKQL